MGQKLPPNDSIAIQMVTPAICLTCVKGALHMMAILKWRLYEPRQRLVRMIARQQFGSESQWDRKTRKAVRTGTVIADTEYVAALLRGEH